MKWTSPKASACSLITAIVATSILANLAQAQVSSPRTEPSAENVSTNPPPEQAPEKTPLMAALAPTPIGKGLEAARIDIYGWLQGSYQYNFNRPFNAASGRYENNGRTYDFFQHDVGYLNQADLNIERKVETNSTAFDVGGHVEAMFGTDAFFTHSYGLLDHETTSHGLYQLDLLQAYIDVAVPVGSGIRIRAGKFEFVKPINPNARLFYTDTFAYHGSFPFTVTGITATYWFAPNLSVESGISRGWNVSVKDNNGSIDGLARVVWQIAPDKRFTAGLIAGPELPHNSSHWTTALDIGYSQNVTDNFAIFFDAVFNAQAGAPLGTPPGTPAPARVPATVSHANYYGVSADALYQFNELLALGGRFEWLRDEEGYLTGVASVDLYDATLGLTITPFYATPMGKNILIRPELRYDYASIPLFYPSPGKYGQFTFAIDLIINF